MEYNMKTFPKMKVGQRDSPGIFNILKQPNAQQNCVYKLWYIYSVEYYSAIRKGEIFVLLCWGHTWECSGFTLGWLYIQESLLAH